MKTRKTANGLAWKLRTTERFESSWLQGYTDMTIEKAIEIFGPPQEAGDKTTAEWELRFPGKKGRDGRPLVATLYDYRGSQTLHIGGNDPNVVTYLLEILISLGHGYVWAEALPSRREYR